MESEQMNIGVITAKANCKREMCRILQLEGEDYFPPNSQANHNYVSKILSGTKKVLLSQTIYSM